MTDFLEVGQFHKNDNTGKWRFQRLGYAKKNDKGGLDVYLDALPIPGPHGVRLTISKKQEGSGGRGQGSASKPDPQAPFEDEQIPF